VYLNPPFATPLLMSVMSANFLLNLAWIFLWDRYYMIMHRFKDNSSFTFFTLKLNSKYQTEIYRDYLRPPTL